MKKIAGVLIILFPVIGIAQTREIAGIWLLKERKSISGPNYNNGLPKVIRIDYSGKAFKIQTVDTYKEKDTVETQIIYPGKQPVETVSASNRRKLVSMEWEQSNNTWIKNTKLSAKQEFSKPEISIVETMKLSEAGTQLIVMKNYEGSNDPQGNKDYIMQGVYEKTSEQGLALKSAKGKGIRFASGLSWNQILAKAKRENKFIFIDCYATWCGPCKKMDKEVFDLNMVGDEMNEKFISIKVQMDTAKKDDAIIKATYPIARYLEKEFNISILPTYLFFSPNGTIVHKAAGAFSGDDFITLSHTARNPSLQIYTLLRKAESNRLPHEEMLDVVKHLERSGDKALAEKVARYYFEQYLYKLKSEEFFEKGNVEIFSKYRNAILPSDKIFEFLLNSPERADSLLGNGKGFAAGLVESVIVKTEIQPILLKAEKPGKVAWDLVENNIKTKYGEDIAYRSTINAKVYWYRKHEMWDRYTENLVLQVELIGDLNNIHWANLNSAAWSIFRHSEDKSQLEKALVWSEVAIKNHKKDTTIQNAPWGGILDTYANLLYKLGRKDEAIKFYQEKILNNGVQKISIYENYVKMFKGDPTWPTSD